MKVAIVRTVALVLLVSMVEIVRCQIVSTCSNTFCPRGRMCTELPGGGTNCQCPANCPAIDAPVCSVYGIQFTSRCHLHKFACERMNINIGIKNQGPCDDSDFGTGLKRCNEVNLLQFPNRYLDWVLIARQRNRSPKLLVVPTVRGNELTSSTVREILEWEFRTIDGNSNGQLDQDEISEIERELQSIDESCIQGFLKSCDMDSDTAISLREWYQCFPRGTVSETIGGRRKL